MFPVNLNLDGRLFLLVGAGRVGRRKLVKLLNAGARGRIVEPEADDALLALCPEGRVEIYPEYKISLLEGVSLVLAASTDRALNRRVAVEAKGRGLWVNVADQPELSNFELPALVERGDFLLTVSTGGCSPALAARVAERLRADFGPEYEKLTRLLGLIRPRVLASALDNQSRGALFKRLLDSDALYESLAAEDRQALGRLLKELLGPLELSEKEIETLVNLKKPTAG